MQNNLPIGLFDSGVGGLTIMSAVARLLPHEDLIYIGDTARVPYGTKSPETIQKYTTEAISFLLEKKIKLLIIACHTACSHSLATLQAHCPVPVIGVLRSGFEELALATKNNRVAIIGTSSTIQSGVYQNLIHKKSPHIQVFPLACPLFVPLIEEGLIDHPATKLIADHYLSSLREKQIDAALLACTHYPLIRSLIQESLGSHVQLVEPAAATAQEALSYLSNTKQLSEPKKSHLQFYATDDPTKFSRMAKLFFGSEVKEVLTAKFI